MTDWIDESGITSHWEQPCFVCGDPTMRVDIDYEAPFCNSVECNSKIAYDLQEEA